MLGTAFAAGLIVLSGISSFELPARGRQKLRATIEQTRSVEIWPAPDPVAVAAPPPTSLLTSGPASCRAPAAPSEPGAPEPAPSCNPPEPAETQKLLFRAPGIEVSLVDAPEPSPVRQSIAPDPRHHEARSGAFCTSDADVRPAACVPSA